MFQLETRNVETGVVYKSPLFNDFASARAEAQRVAKAGRRTVRVVQVAEPEVVGCTYHSDCECDEIAAMLEAEGN